MLPHEDNNSGQGASSEQPARTDAQPYKDARVFRDVTGAPWFVHEVSGEALGGGSSCLLLVSAQQVRRVSPVPAGWRALSPAALLALKYERL